MGKQNPRWEGEKTILPAQVRDETDFGWVGTKNPRSWKHCSFCRCRVGGSNTLKYQAIWDDLGHFVCRTYLYVQPTGSVQKSEDWGCPSIGVIWFPLRKRLSWMSWILANPQIVETSENWSLEMPWANQHHNQHPEAQKMELIPSPQYSYYHQKWTGPKMNRSNTKPRVLSWVLTSQRKETAWTSFLE